MLDDNFIFRFPRVKEWNPVLIEKNSYGHRLEDIIRYYFEKDYGVDLEPIDALATLENRVNKEDEHCMPDYKMIGVDPESPFREIFLKLGEACVDVKLSSEAIRRCRQKGLSTQLKHMQKTNTQWYIFVAPLDKLDFRNSIFKHILFRSELEKQVDIEQKSI